MEIWKYHGILSVQKSGNPEAGADVNAPIVGTGMIDEEYD